MTNNRIRITSPPCVVRDPQLIAADPFTGFFSVALIFIQEQISPIKTAILQAMNGQGHDLLQVIPETAPQDGKKYKLVAETTRPIQAISRNKTPITPEQIEDGATVRVELSFDRCRSAGHSGAFATLGGIQLLRGTWLGSYM